MNGRVQIVLGANVVDNIRACLCALMTHPEVHWVGHHLALVELRTVWRYRRVAKVANRPADTGERVREFHPLAGGEFWYYRSEREAYQWDYDGWHQYELAPFDTLVFKKNLDKTTLTMLLAQAADFFHAKRRKPTPTSVPASLVKLLLEVGEYDPFPSLGTSDRFNIRRHPKLLVHDPDTPVLWAHHGDGLERFKALHEERLQLADIDPPTGVDLDAPGEPAGFVYFIGRADGEGLVKIGHSDDPERRLGELQTGSPVELAIIGAVLGSEAYEQELHARLTQSRRHGEWFERHAALALLTQLQRGEL